MIVGIQRGQLEVCIADHGTARCALPRESTLQYAGPAGGPGWPPLRLCRKNYPIRAAGFADAPETMGGRAMLRPVRRS